MERRVLLFGLSGDPPTGEGGHLGLVRWAASRALHPELGGPLDAIWVVPVARHAYTEKAGLAPFEHRLAMCRLCFEGRGLPVPVTVSDAERALAESRPGESLGTIDLLEQLEREHPSVRFGLLLGADTARDLLEGRWRRAEEVRMRYPVVVVPRAGVETAPALRDAIASDAPRLRAVSSTAARLHSELRAWVTPEVAAYIEAHHLYGR